MIRPPIRPHAATATALAVAALLAMPVAHAQDGITTKVSGFGTFGSAKNNGAGTYRSSGQQYRGAHDNNPDFGVDSRLGVQGDVQFNEVFSATGQLLSIRRHDDFKPKVEWFYGQAKLNNNISLRAGRLGLPAFLVSDFRNVGYATPWIRTPVEAYSGLPFNTFDGIQGVFRQSLGGFNVTVQPSYGKSKGRVTVATPALPLPLDLTLETNKLLGVNALIEHGDWTVRWGTVRTESDVRVVGKHPVFGWILLRNSVFKDNFTGYGLQYDNGSLLVMSELVTRRSVSTNTNGHYITAGYRLGPWTPYATLGGYKDKSGAQKSKSSTLGLRWDAMKNLSVKTQYDSSEPEPGAFLPPLPPATEKARVISFAVDFVF